MSIDGRFEFVERKQAMEGIGNVQHGDRIDTCAFRTCLHMFKRRWVRTVELETWSDGLQKLELCSDDRQGRSPALQQIN